MPNIENLRGVAFKQREKLRVSKEQMLQRIEDSPFGPKGKELARQALENESYGAMGWLLWVCLPSLNTPKALSSMTSMAKTILICCPVFGKSVW